MFSLNHGHSLLPLRFKDYFSFHKEVSRREKSNDSYDTKYANDIHLPFCTANLRKFSVSFQGPIFSAFYENEIKVLLVSPHSKQIFVNTSVRIINYKPCK